MTPADGTTVISYLRQTLCADALDSAPDEELLERFVSQGDETAFAALVRRHGLMVWGVCQRLLTHQQDAEDAFQATFLVLARKAARIGRRKLLTNWLFGVARRAALHARGVRARRAHQERLCGDPPDMVAMPEASWDDVRAVVDEEIARLPEKYRLPLLLCGLEGMTHADAGRHLGWPTGTVAGRLSRGREVLRARLLRRGVTAPGVALTAILVSAAVPRQLVAATVHSAAALVTAAPAAAVISPTVAALMRGVLLTMFLSRLLTTTGLLAALALTLGGAGALWLRAPAAEARPSAPGGLAQKRLSAVAAAKPAGAVPTGKPAIRLPTDPNAVVLRMDRSVDGVPGLVMGLTIHADGRVRAEVPDGSVSLAEQDLIKHAKSRVRPDNPDRDPEPPKIKAFEGRLSARELEELLRFALHDQEFFDFDPDAVKATMREQYQSDGNNSRSSDAVTTCYRVQTADRAHEVRWLGLPKTVWDFPKVERVLQLSAVDQRLQQLFYVLMAGGPERVAAVAEKMDRLAEPHYRLYPGVPRLTATDLSSVTPSPDGTRLRFVFARFKDKTIGNPLFAVAIDVPQHGEPTLAHVIPPQQGGGRPPSVPERQRPEH
jgi:RNA polymerase sigma factor (sigma-70 family)